MTIDHNFGKLEVPLTGWIAKGPGPRKFLELCAARSGSTGEPLPLDVVPLIYRNTEESRRLIAEGKLENPWPER